MTKLYNIRVHTYITLGKITNCQVKSIVKTDTIILISESLHRTAIIFLAELGLIMATMTIKAPEDFINKLYQPLKFRILLFF